MSRYCPNCGSAVDDNAKFCNRCGCSIAGGQSPSPQQPQQQVSYRPAPAPSTDYIDPNWPVKEKTTAGILAILLGDLGVHKFYLGNVGLGILYLLFCWTGIPAIVGLIEGIIYLTSSDRDFQIKNKVRIA